LPFLRFGLSGLPGFVLGLALNVFLVERGGWPRPVAYGLVVWLQMSCGFVMCRYVVFAEGREVPLLKAYAQFVGSMALIRVADWLLYTLAVEVLAVPFVIAQVSMTAIFIVLKFISAKAIFSRRISH
jgi:putative flippase GtrA